MGDIAPSFVIMQDYLFSLLIGPTVWAFCKLNFHSFPILNQQTQIEGAPPPKKREEKRERVVVWLSCLEAGVE